MKAEHRHELQTNELAEWLEKTIDKFKPYTRAIIGVAVAVLIILGVYLYVGSLDRRAQAEASNQFLQALGTPEELQSVIDHYRGTKPAELAQLVLAEGQLRDGTDQLYTNKPVARTNLSSAAGAFAQAEAVTHDPMLRAWALYGEGRAYESLGNLDRARTTYQNLITDYPDSALVDGARSHLANLNRTGTKEFYDWFAQQDPRPQAMDKDTGIPGLKPAFDLSDPSSFGTRFPGSGDSGAAEPAGTPADDSKSTAGPSDAKAPTDAKASTDSKSPTSTDSKTPADTKTSKAPPAAKGKK
jgi:tetratricopeptide (TPR) repeat protein